MNPKAIYLCQLKDFRERLTVIGIKIHYTKIYRFPWHAEDTTPGGVYISGGRRKGQLYIICGNTLHTHSRRYIMNGDDAPITDSQYYIFEDLLDLLDV